MQGKEYEKLEEDIDILRNELNSYAKYREIYRDEILKISQELDILIVKHMRLKKDLLLKTK